MNWLCARIYSKAGIYSKNILFSDLHPIGKIANLLPFGSLIPHTMSHSAWRHDRWAKGHWLLREYWPWRTSLTIPHIPPMGESSTNTTATPTQSFLLGHERGNPLPGEYSSWREREVSCVPGREAHCRTLEGVAGEHGSWRQETILPGGWQLGTTTPPYPFAGSPLTCPPSSAYARLVSTMSYCWAA